MLFLHFFSSYASRDRTTPTPPIQVAKGYETKRSAQSPRHGYTPRVPSLTRCALPWCRSSSDARACLLVGRKFAFHHRQPRLTPLHTHQKVAVTRGPLLGLISEHLTPSRGSFWHRNAGWIEESTKSCNDSLRVCYTWVHRFAHWSHLQYHCKKQSTHFLMSRTQKD